MEGKEGRRAIRKLILIVNLAAPILLVLLWNTRPILGLVVLFAAHVLALYPTLAANSQWWGPVVTSFDSEGEKVVWLTIDDGPDPEDTPRILDLLEAHRARATFFVKGSLAERHPDLVRRVLTRGHEVANHSYSHPSATFWCLPPSRISREVDLGARAIQNAADTFPRRFRAPVGMKNFWVHPLLEKRGMQLVGWSARGWDTITTSPLRAAARIMREVRPGTIIMLHEGPAISNHRGYDVLEQLLPRLAQEGFRCIIPEDGQLARFATHKPPGWA